MNILHDADTPAEPPTGDHTQDCARCGIELHRIAEEDVGAAGFQFFPVGDLTIIPGLSIVSKTPGSVGDPTPCEP